ncbi:hypothetical protein K1T71_012052 [Dendrolimus kikuchii]|uniref:Uncharacterized protein n=1 Tax=Dendrolimus kikuchii TaxID=765133 RepID=A0ACC1CKG9_9NEOP|nr:hypothetical protein K1T71_012052 [Dendrolimus kikuchii]
MSARFRKKCNKSPNLIFSLTEPLKFSHSRSVEESIFGAMDKLKIGTIFVYDFLRGNTDAQTTGNINDVHGPNTACINTVHYWFNRLKSGNLELKNEPRGQPVTIVDNDELKAIVEADPTQSTAELAAGGS